MEVKTIVTNITHDDLVNLISTAGCGSSWLDIDYNTEDYLKCPDRKEDDCIEDKIARILLNGGKVIFFDMCADEDDFNKSKLPHRWDDDNQWMGYIVTLDDIEEGLAKAASTKGYLGTYFQDLLNEDGNLDQPEAEALVQVILWGEQIYG